MVNLSGAVLLGFVTGLIPGHAFRVIVATAALGSYTTFSGWMLATDDLARERGAAAAALNLLLPLVFGLAAAALGRTAGQAF